MYACTCSLGSLRYCQIARLKAEVERANEDARAEAVRLKAEAEVNATRFARS